MRSAAIAVAPGALVMALAAVGVIPVWPGLVHAVALPPLDLAFDLRLLVARAPSWPLFALGAAASILVRSAALAAAARALSGRSLSLRRAALFYAAAAVPLGVAAGLEFAGLAAVYAWYAYAGVGLLVATVLAFAPATIRIVVDPRGRRVLTAAIVYVLAVSLLGAVARVGRWTILLVVPSAALTYGTLTLVRRRAEHPRRAAPPGAALALAVLVVSTSPPAPHPVRRDARPGLLLLVPGVDTRSGAGALYRFDPEAVGFRCADVFYFSYRGPGSGAARGEAPCRLRLHAPYDPRDTQRPLRELADAFVRQFAAIRRSAGGAPVVVITHSQGAWIAWDAIARRRVVGVTHLVMLAPATRSPVAYPPPGEDGEGRIGGDALRALSAGARGLGTGTFDPDAPLALEMLGDDDALERLFGRSLPARTDGTPVFAAFDAVVSPEGSGIRGGAVAVTATHTGITTSSGALRAVRDILARRSPTEGSLVAGILRAALEPYMPPAT